MLTELAGWLDILACPSCRGALKRQGDGVLACPACPEQFPVSQGILSLIPKHRDAELEAHTRNYSQARRDEGWRPMTPRELAALPDGSPDGYPPLYWEVRRQTFEAFTRFLRQEGPTPGAGPAADLGAGTGWLAHRLAGYGYRTLALDASLDPDFGLGASALYRTSCPERFLPVQGDLAFPPLRQACFGLVVFNASLHYARPLGRTLQRAAEALRPGAYLVILDTPIARQPQPGSRLGDRHLGRRELEGALQDAGLQPRYVHIRRGPRWHAYRLRAALQGDAPFSFPMVVGATSAKSSGRGGS